MKRYLIENFGVNDEMRDKAIVALEDIGGGVIAMPLKRNYFATFNLKADGDFTRLENRMRARGIRLTWQRRGMPHRGNVLAIYPTRGLLEELESIDGIDTLIVLGWTQAETDAWRDEYDPELIEGGTPMPEWAKH